MRGGRGGFANLYVFLDYHAAQVPVYTAFLDDIPVQIDVHGSWNHERAILSFRTPEHLK